MNSKLRILLLEDSSADAALIEHELEADGFLFSLTLVQTEQEFRSRLAADPPDLVLSDNGLSTFDAFKALEITRAVRPQLPFIFISSSNDQGMVVEMYEQGATDYVFKRDIGDLKSAVHHALEPPSTAPSSTEFTTSLNPEQAELTLPLSKMLPMPLPFTSAIGHLFFCPQCRWAHDESGRIVQMENYCDHCVEIIVIRQVCAECQEPGWWK